MEYIRKFKLPAMSHFKSSKAGPSPFNILQTYIIEDCFGGLGKCPITSVSNIVINPIDYKILKKFVRDWAKKSHRHYSARSLDNAIGMHELDAGPSENDEVIPGYIYIRKTVE